MAQVIHHRRLFAGSKPGAVGRRSDARRQGGGGRVLATPLPMMATTSLTLRFGGARPPDTSAKSSRSRFDIGRAKVARNTARQRSHDEPSKLDLRSDGSLMKSIIEAVAWAV
jgi:hypothetical protein